jgi:hypothetical protein
MRSLNFLRGGNPEGLKRTLSHRTQNARRENEEMLWTIFVVLLILWLLGFVGFHALGAYIHILLLIALVVLVIQLISGRRVV